MALPTILTLHSGAALAAQASSRFIGTVKKASSAVGKDGKIQCLDQASAVGGTWNKLDLGSQPMLHVQYITPRSYYKGNGAGTAGDPSRPVTVENMCSQGGVYWYRDGWSWDPNATWKATTTSYSSKGIKAGFLCSATALSSFASAIKIKSVF